MPMCTCMDMCTRVYIHANRHVYIFTSRTVMESGAALMSMCVCASYVCVYIYIYIYIHIHVYLSMYIYMYKCICIYIIYSCILFEFSFPFHFRQAPMCLAEVTVARRDEFGTNDRSFRSLSHLGNVLRVGDFVWGYAVEASPLHQEVSHHEAE